MADTPGALDLGTLLLHLQTDNSEFVSGFTEAGTVSEGIWSLITKNAELTEVAVVGAFVGMAAAAVKAWSEMEDAVQTASQQMGNTNNLLTQELQQAARSIAESSSTSVKEATDAYSALAKSGYSAAQSIMALPEINQAAIASGNSLTDTVNTLVGAQKALGLETSNTAQNTANLTMVSDTLIKASQESNATFAQLGNALGGLTGVELKQFNLSVQQAVAVMAALADAGVPVESSGRTFRTLLETLADTATTGSYAFKQLGIDVYNTGGQLLPFNVILDNMRTHLSGLTGLQQQAALQTLGFSSQTSALAKVLINATGSVDAYTDSFNHAADATKNAAEQGDNTLAKQFDQTVNSAKELVLELGQALAPAVSAILKTFNDFIATNVQWKAGWQDFIQNIGPAVITVVGLIGDAFQGWEEIWTLEDIGYKTFLADIVDLLNTEVKFVATLMQDLLNSIVADVNTAIGYIDKILPSSKQIPTITWKLDVDTSQGVAQLNSWSDTLHAAVDKDMTALDGLTSSKFSDTLAKNYNAATTSIVADNKTIAASVKGALSNIKAPVNPGQDLENQVVTAFSQVGKNGYGFDNKQLYPNGQSKDPLTEATAANQPSDFNQKNVVGLQDQLAQEEKAYKTAQDAIDKARTDGTTATNTKVEALMKTHAATITAIQTQLADVAIQQVGDIFGSLATIASNTVGQASGAYEALFAMSKAFAIADSTIKIQQAIANAFSTGVTVYQQIADAAIIAAQMSSIVSSIESVSLSFGGGKESGGQVSSTMSYLVGEAGPELFTPSTNGNITPNDMLGGNANNITVNVHNSSGAHASVVKSKDSNGGDVYDVVIAKVKSALATDIQNGTGPVNRAMTGAFGLKRGKTS